MKKVIKSAKKKSPKEKEDGELKKPMKLKPLKEKERKGWKNKLGDDEDEDFIIEDDLKLNNDFEEDGGNEYDGEYYDEF